MEVSSRLSRLRPRIAESGCDALLVTSLCNLRYLTGFTGSAGMLLVRQDDAVFYSDGRYGEQSSLELAAAGVEVSFEIGRPLAQLEALGQAVRGLSRLAVEAGAIAWAEKRRLAAVLVASGARAELVATESLVEELRVVKDPGELARIEMACDIADVALAQVKSRLEEGLTEKQFAIELDYEMRRRGADDVSFESIVASGPNGALPHHRPTDHPIGEGDVVVLDFGALVEGYHSDMTRTLAVGAPAPEMIELMDAVLVAQRAGVRAVRPGAKCADVDEACREVLRQLGHEELFVHGTGHGVGLEIHEAPALGKGSTDILEEGAVVTVEPGAYLVGTGGVRIEDTLVVTATGSRQLTKSTKDTTL
jgi:Xaa-Pro aminopeptidase